VPLWTLFFGCSPTVYELFMHTSTHKLTNTTRKDVGEECRHDMRPSVQLPSVSGVDSKLCLTIVRPSLQSTPEPSALVPPPVAISWGVLRQVSLTIDLSPFQLKTGISFTRTVGNVCSNFDFSTLLCFRVTSPYGTDGRTDKRTGKTRNGRPHNCHVCCLLTDWANF